VVTDKKEALLRRLWNRVTITAVVIAVPVIAYGDSTKMRQAFIDTPDACYQAEQQKDDSVYLKAVGVCGAKPGRAFIKSNSDKVKIYVEGELWKEMSPQPLTIPDIEVTLKKVEELSNSIKIPSNPSETNMVAVAKSVNAYYQSPDFQRRLLTETERIKKEVLGSALAQYYPDSEKDIPPKGKLGEDERIYVFVSSSMPLQTIRNYAASISRYGDPKIMMVLRGFVGGVGKIQPTIDLVGRVVQRNPACNSVKEGECEILPVPFGVDPLLFRRYGIDRVPAVVYARGVKAEDTGLSEGDDKNAIIGEFWKAFGDASLEYIVEQMQRESGSQGLLQLVDSSR
jgi:type-F conjugative transfer system pilin assembly protein TrbC